MVRDLNLSFNTLEPNLEGGWRAVRELATVGTAAVRACDKMQPGAVPERYCTAQAWCPKPLPFHCAEVNKPVLNGFTPSIIPCGLGSTCTHSPACFLPHLTTYHLPSVTQGHVLQAGAFNRLVMCWAIVNVQLRA